MLNGRERRMCCRGCAAAAQAIHDFGLERFYRVRTADAPRPAEPTASELERIRVFDEPSLQRHFVEAGGNRGRADLILERIACPACCWLIERRLQELAGVLAAHVDFSANRAHVEWDPARLRLSEILRAIAELGYGAQPYEPAAAGAALDLERRTQLRRLALAGLFGMQVMMISVALYFGEWSGIEDVYRSFLRWTALLLTIPVIGYSAAPFFRNAWRDLRALRAGMDVPVSLGLGIAFLGSVHATWSGSGQVYYDSATMFVFLLLGGRYLEFNVRRGLATRLDWLHRIEPAVATRLEPGAGDTFTERIVPTATLVPGDRILVRPGECLPADGIVLEGETSVDESLISGESLPVRRGPGDRVIGGSGNVESPMHVRIEHVGDDTVLAIIRRLAERCQAEKPALTELANRAAGWFVAAVLVLTAGAAWYWLRVDPGLWLPVTISMLVITCPCALALAAPTALAAATGTLLRHGLLAVRANAIEMLACATLFAFDKTGTLTLGRPVVREVRARDAWNPDECLRIAAALETGSSHPVAVAIQKAAEPAADAQSAQHFPGEGVTGMVEGRRWVLGNPAFIRRMSGLEVLPEAVSRSAILLATGSSIAAEIEIEDQPRPHAGELVGWLREHGRRTLLLSGDAASVVAELAGRLGIDESRGCARPGEKVAVIEAARRAGHTVCMVGDGINDAPVLAAAHVSIAMGGGTDLAKTSADLILLDGRLASLRAGIGLAVRTLGVIRLNVAWAIGYNLLALPLAASGWVPPWLAALGMSASSLLVTANSARLTRTGRP
jgi:Cu2+-exporting ATPase